MTSISFSMASSSSRLILSSFVGDCRIQSCPSLYFRFGYKPGTRDMSIQLSRTLCGVTDFLFNKRKSNGFSSKNLKRLGPGKVSPRLPVPDHIPKPPYVKSRQLPGINGGPEVHDEEGMKCMRESGKLAAKVLEYAGTLVQPGTTTDEIDKAVHQMIIDRGAYPSPLGYGGFPKSVCTSVNECICHGIPDSRALEDGDIINIDVTVYLNGYHGDTSATFFCGNVEEEAKQLVEVTRECLYKAISVCGPGVEFKKIGQTIHFSLFYPTKSFLDLKGKEKSRKRITENAKMPSGTLFKWLCCGSSPFCVCQQQTTCLISEKIFSTPYPSCLPEYYLSWDL